MQRPLQSIKGKRITTYQQVEIDNTLTLCDAMGKCERIKTPFSNNL
jgi:hypothetical protein